MPFHKKMPFSTRTSLILVSASFFAKNRQFLQKIGNFNQSLLLELGIQPRYEAAIDLWV